ncbi:MAG: tyrosine-type recombinase/integrase [Hassallia sp. WJT32-NPBG1]|jgi:integrase/recombinase XerC|nr:tyrosine-type recombinase/integrase [Hassallia sp. WJT32-NPBG1]
MSNLEPIKITEVSVLESSLSAKIERYFDTLDTDPDVLAQLLSDKRSQNTRDAYAKDIRDFFREMTNGEPTQDRVLEFLHLEERQAIAAVLKYKSQLFKRGLKEATVNRRLAAIKSLVLMGKKLGVCAYSLTDLIKGEKAEKYRDTSGVSREAFRLILQQCDRNTTKGKRDYALLRLLWDNALRRGEIAQANIGDFNAGSRTLKIKGKGKGTQIQRIDLAPTTVAALTEWLDVRHQQSAEKPLFIALDFANHGHRLTGEAIRYTVDKLSQKAGIEKRMSPHRVRHSSITAALDATDGNIRKVQKLSRHADPRTLMIYDDNRAKDQDELSGLLADMV